MQSTPAIARWIATLTAFTALLALSACNGKGTVPDEFASKTARSHLSLIGPDALMVLTSNNLVERGQTIRSSRAYAQFRKFIESTLEDPEIIETMLVAEGTHDMLQQHLKGRATIAAFPSNTTDDEAVLIVIDGDSKALLNALEEMYEPGVTDYKPIGDDIFQKGGDDPDEDDRLFVFQAGPTGFIATSEDLIRNTRAVAQGLTGQNLMEERAFTGLTEDLDNNADMLFWLRDWTDTEDSWSSMLGDNTGEQLPRGIAATVDLEDGVNVEMLFDLSVEDLSDPALKSLLPAFGKVEAAPKLPARLPLDTLGYVGFNLSIEELLPALSQLGQALGEDMPTIEDQRIARVIEAFLAGFEGELGIALTSLPLDGPVSQELGFPVPGVVLMATLTSPESAKTLKPMLELIFGEFQTGPDRLLGPGQEMALGAATAVIFPTQDPGLTLGYAFDGDVMLFGTGLGLKDILSKPVKPSQSMAQATGHNIVGQAFDEPSNYQVHLNLGAIYNTAIGHFGPMLQLYTGGALGKPGDALSILFSVFEYAGGSMRYQDGRAQARFYLTANDLGNQP